MSSWRMALFFVTTLLLLGACATRPINPPIVQYNSNQAAVFEKLRHNRGNQQDLVILAFSGGGIRSATFNLGVLQGLAQAGLLAKAKYLSTVSGGGVKDHTRRPTGAPT